MRGYAAVIVLLMLATESWGQGLQNPISSTAGTISESEVPLASSQGGIGFLTQPCSGTRLGSVGNFGSSLGSASAASGSAGIGVTPGAGTNATSALNPPTTLTPFAGANLVTGTAPTVGITPGNGLSNNPAFNSTLRAGTSRPPNRPLGTNPPQSGSGLPSSLFNGASASGTNLGTGFTPGAGFNPGGLIPLPSGSTGSTLTPSTPSFGASSSANPC